jgi:hypothetical protein
MVSDLKGAGYLTSTASVILLGAASWRTASQTPASLVFLIIGMLLSVGGMLLRWRSHRMDQKQHDQAQKP